MHLGFHIELDTPASDLLLQALPPVSHIRAARDEAPVLCWLLDQLVHEMTAARPAAGCAADQLAQLLFVHVLRAYLAGGNTHPPGLFAVLADEQLAPALRMMHNDPARPWHLEELARAAAMSRTTFAEPFKTAAGVPPLTYLTNWRMHLARQALREQDTPLSALAPALGYTSESAFGNAFKRATGMAPKRYREAARAA